MGENHDFGKKNRNSQNAIPIHCEKNDFYTVKLKLYRENDIAASSTAIRTHLVRGEVEKACDMLGHPYLILAKRTRGERLGTKLGFPTFNFVPPPSQKAVPPPGVYAARLEYGGTRLVGCLYFGACPTFRENKRGVRFEFYSLESFKTEPYIGENTRLWVYARIREDRSFSSSGALTAQIQQDVERIRNYFWKE
jgi:riboflavin kinase/FMN adenylyltransferase